MINVDNILVTKAKEFARQEHLKLIAAPAPIISTTHTPLSTPTTITSLTSMAVISSYANMIIFNRIYIGSINFDLTDADIESVFGQFGPLKSIEMMMDPIQKRHRGYGFLEYYYPEAAALAQTTMDNAFLGGRNIRVGRPNNYPNDLPPGIPRALPNRIYVANIHDLVQESDIRGIFEAFGRTKHCRLLPDLDLLQSPSRIRKHRGFGFVEFEQVASALLAIQSVNGIELVSKPLRVGKTVIGGEIPLGMASINQIEEALITASINTVKKVPSAVLRAAQQIEDMQKALEEMKEKETKEQEENNKSHVLVLRNLEDYNLLIDDPAIQDELQEDVLEECNRFGVIIKSRIYLDRYTETVKFFVQYERSGSVEEAIEVMDKRWFGGRMISAEVYDQLKFNDENFQS